MRANKPLSRYEIGVQTNTLSHDGGSALQLPEWLSLVSQANKGPHFCGPFCFQCFIYYVVSVFFAAFGSLGLKPSSAIC